MTKPDRTRTFQIVTDAISAPIEATCGDDAARQFAVSEHIANVTDAADLCDHYREIGGTIRIIDADGVLLCRVG